MQSRIDEILESYYGELVQDPVLAVREILGIELAPHQRIAMRGMWTHSWSYNVWGRGTGKCQDMDTPVPTPDGWVRMGDLQVGSAVLDEQGNTCDVTYLSPIYTDKDCYRITFDDGTSVVSSHDHLWQASTSSSRKHAKYGNKRHVPENWVGVDDWRECWESTSTVTTREMYETQKSYSREDNNWGIPCSKPMVGSGSIEYPYTLGSWLGDGTASDASIACHVDDLVNLSSSLSSEGVRHSVRPGSQKEWSSCPVIGMLGMRPFLREFGVLGDKHIPMSVLRADYATRLAVLQGLMDTDGFLADNRKNSGMCGIDFTDERLHEDVAELIRTFGWKARQGIKIVQYNGQPKSVYQINFRPDVQVFRLPRKAERLTFDNKQKSRHTIHMITSIEAVDPVPVRCITVDSPSHLYLVGKNFVPTHNTFMDAVFSAVYAAMNPRTNIVLVGPGFRQAQFIFKNIELFASQSSVFMDCIKGGKNGIKHSANEWSIEFKNGSVIYAVPLGTDGSKIRGYRAHVLVIDELVQVPYQIVATVLFPFMSTYRDPMAMYLGESDTEEGNILIMSTSAFFTFNHAYDRFCTFLKEIYGNHSSDYFLSQFNLNHTPKGFINTKMVEMSRKQMTEAEYKMEYLGEWVTDTEGFYPASLIDTVGDISVYPEIAGEKNAEYVLGVDPASTFNTCGLALIKLGPTLKVVKVESPAGLSNPQICSRITEYMSNFNIVRIGIDQGASTSILNLFQEGRPVVDKDGNKLSITKLVPLDADVGVEGRRMFQIIPGTTQAVTEINYLMKGAMEDGSVKWPKIAGDATGDLLDEREKLIDQFKELESEYRMVEATQNKSGYFSYSVPEHKNKDRYSASLFAHAAARAYMGEGTTKEELPVGFWLPRRVQ